MQDLKKKTNKKGVSGVDISVAIVVISIGLSIIISLFLIIARTTNKVNREIEATQLAKSVLEKIKLMPYNDFTNMVKEVSNENYSMSLGIEIPDAYALEIETERKTPINLNEAILFNIRKEGNIIVKYMLSQEMTEIKLPYVKYFDRIYPKNKPDLNSRSIISPNSYSSGDLFEPLDDLTHKSLNPDEVENWLNYGIKDASLNKKYARRKNTDNVYDLFYWEPRNIEVESETKHLLGKTMYGLESFVKTVEYPSGQFVNVLITMVEEKTGIPNSGEEEGTWVYQN